MFIDHLWMVGFRLCTGTDRLVKHFYVVRDARDEHHARQLAARLADTPVERRARSYTPLDETWAEVLLLRRDDLGNWRPRSRTAAVAASAQAQAVTGRNELSCRNSSVPSVRSTRSW
ncbi:hypothetical protein [Streptomyces sp. NPDC098781]|uniref:hypothetical protein n=1 Tax=Streptomyces sp. NPDC098781 TaxID=3366097 RepID=UPI003828FEE7